jgi:hypothetical protein
MILGKCNINILRKIIKISIGDNKLQCSCYDINVLQKQLEDFIELDEIYKVMDYIYANCEYIDAGKLRKCDCFIKNDKCFCNDSMKHTKPELKLHKDLPIIEDSQLTLF